MTEVVPIAVVYALIELIKWILKGRQRLDSKEILKAEVAVIMEKLDSIKREQDKNRQSQQENILSLAKIVQQQEQIARVLDKLLDRLLTK